MIKRKISILILIIVSFMAVVSVKPKAANAQAQCLGQGLADYMSLLYQTINSECGGLSNIRLLSPAWNMTNNLSYPIISTATATDPTIWGPLFGVAGNAYDYQSDSGVLDHVTRFMSGSGMPGLPVFLTETGVFRDGDTDRFTSHLSQIKTGSAAGYTFLGAAFFAPFDGLGGAEWDEFHLDDGQIRAYCGGECTNIIGFNSATYFDQVSNSVYQDARNNLNMGTTVSITNLDPADIAPIVRALDNGFTPVVRIGDATRADDAGLEADTYGSFLCQLDGSVGGRTLYAIAGPNEPQSECWFAPQCGCTTDEPFGDERHPLEWDEGFWLGKYPCDETADPEFHNYRPYPASPCDLLIPRSVPEAPDSPLPDGQYGTVPYEDLEKGTWKKYLNYACGSNITYSTIGTFDPYGRDCVADPDSCYVYSDLDINQENPFLLQVCDRSSWDPDAGGPVTCYMTLKFRIRMDFSDAKVGILGNTQLTQLTSAQKVNNYLAYYWGGIPNWDGTVYDEVCTEGEEFDPAPTPEPNGCSGITYDFSPDPANPNSGLSVVITRPDSTSNTCQGNWNNVGLMYDGSDDGNTGITIRTTESPYSYNGSVNNTGSEGNHSVTLTLNDGACICNSGTIQVGEPDPPECEYEAVDFDEDHIINYSGPIKKLLPDEAQDSIRNTIVESREEEVHNYLVEDEDNGPDNGIQGGAIDTRLNDLDNFLLSPFLGSNWPNVPLGSMEDMAGEVFFTGINTGGAVGTDPVSGLTTAPYQFNVTCAVAAHEDCPF